MSSNPNADREKSSHNEKANGSTFATSTTNTASDNSKNQRECVLKDGKHPIWNCEKFKKMNVEERGQKAKELKLCFKCLSDAHQMRRKWLRKTPSQIATRTIQERGTKEK